MPKPKQKNQQRRPNDTQEAIVSRARRMSRSHLKKVWSALGIEGDFSEEKLNHHLEELQKQADEGKSAVERIEGRAQTFEEENKELRQQIASLTNENTKLKHERDSTVAARENEQLEAQVRQAAVAAGVSDTDYGLELFRRYVNGLPDDHVQDEDPKVFFEGLKKDPTKKVLFQPEVVAAHPPSAAERAAATTQPGSQGAPQTPNMQPPPKPAGGQGPVDEANVDALNRQDFASRTMEKYGYRPGA